LEDPVCLQTQAAQHHAAHPIKKRIKIEVVILFLLKKAAFQT
jgi:hypothetical protein